MAKDNSAGSYTFTLRFEIADAEDKDEVTRIMRDIRETYEIGGNTVHIVNPAKHTYGYCHFCENAFPQKELVEVSGKNYCEGCVSMLREEFTKELTGK